MTTTKTYTFPLPEEAENSPALLQHATFRSPSVWELIKGLVRPQARVLDCMQVEVTSQCAARCSYCPHTTHAATWQGQHMHARTFANLWPLLQQSTRVHLQGWGEPFLHPHFFDFVDFARKAECLVSSTSCGLHLSEKNAHKILQSGIDILAFSLAGSDAQSNAVRHGADFHKVCENIRFLQELRKKHMAVHLELHLAYILLADRMEAVLHLPELMHSLGVHTAIISTLDYVPSPELAPLALLPTQSETLARAKALLEEASEQAKKYDIQLYYALPSTVAGAVCRENIQKSLYINAQGDISPCVYLNVPSQSHAHERKIFGNINKESAEDIWRKSSFASFRQSHAQGKPNAHLCQHCVKRQEVLEI